MNIKNGHDLLKEFGIETIIENNALKEKTNVYDNYAMIKKDDNKWFYGVFYQERENNTYFSSQKEFGTESESAKFFFIDMLSHKIEVNVPYPKLNLKDQDYYANYNLDNLYRTMKENNIPQDIFSTEKKKVSRRTIVLREETNKIYKFYYVSSKGEEISNFVSIEKWEAFSACYRAVYKLNYFEQILTPILKEKGVLEEFTEQNIYFFITYKYL